MRMRKGYKRHIHPTEGEGKEERRRREEKRRRGENSTSIYISDLSFALAFLYWFLSFSRLRSTVF